MSHKTNTWYGKKTAKSLGINLPNWRKCNIGAEEVTQLLTSVNCFVSFNASVVRFVEETLAETDTLSSSFVFPKIIPKRIQKYRHSSVSTQEKIQKKSWKHNFTSFSREKRQKIFCQKKVVKTVKTQNSHYSRDDCKKRSWKHNFTSFSREKLQKIFCRKKSWKHNFTSFSRENLQKIFCRKIVAKTVKNTKFQNRTNRGMSVKCDW